MTANFKYNGDGERVQGTVNGVTTAYVGNYFEWSGSALVKYYNAGGQRVGMKKAGSLYFLLGDHLGSTAITATYFGVFYSELRYRAWGVERFSSATETPTTFRFTGQRLEELPGDPEGLYFYNSRWYDPRLTHFIQPDSMVPDPYNPQDWDRYTYSYSNPVKYVDPDGHCPAPPDGFGPAICVALFIAPQQVQAGPFTLRGDNRGFGAYSDPSASRGYIWVSPDGLKADPHMNPSTYLGPAGLSNTVPPSDKNSWTVSRSDNGYIDIEYNLVVSGILDKSCVAPHINGTFSFRTNEDGSIDYAFNRDGFPWAEAYYYDGQGGVETLFKDPAVRGNPHDLYAIESNQGYLSQSVQWFQTNILGYGDPQSSSQNNLCKPGKPC